MQLFTLVLVLLGFDGALLRTTFGVELSCSDVIRTKIKAEEEVQETNFQVELKNEACTLRWHIWCYPCPFGLTCTGNIPQNDSTCSEFFAFEVSDTYGGKYNPSCGEVNFSLRPTQNDYELFVTIESKIGYTGGGFLNCSLTCDKEKEFQPLPIHNSRNRTYYKTNNISQDSDMAEFEWPHRNDEKLGFWSVFGAPNCPVGIQCSLTHYGDCNETEAYVLVSDGTAGEKIFCGNLSFQVGPSDSKLRDMFLKVNAPNDANVVKVNCATKCQRTNEEYPPLLNALERKTDMRCVCGFHNKDDRIIGGENAMMNEYPWQVALVQKNSRMAFCGGTVINDRFILTAEHCVGVPKDFPDEAEVLIHAHVLAQKVPSGIPEFEVYENFDELFTFPIHSSVLDEDRAEKTQRKKIARVIIPNLYTGVRSDYDIALLQLEDKIDLGQPDGPTPVCLPPIGEFSTYTDKFVDKILTVTGWGITETGNQSHALKKANVPYVPDEECAMALAKKTATNRTFLSPRLMCAYHTNEDVINNGTCNGDSGGPLTFQNDNHQYVQVGITSFGSRECPDNGTITAFTKVSGTAK